MLGSVVRSPVGLPPSVPTGPSHQPGRGFRAPAPTMPLAALFPSCHSILGWPASYSAYSCASVFPASFASTQACCNAPACSAGDLLPFMTSRKPVYITSLKFRGARTSML